MFASPVSVPRKRPLLPRRAAIALALGFLVVVAGIAALHPHSGAVLAFNDETGAAYWTNERARAQKDAFKAAPKATSQPALKPASSSALKPAYNPSHTPGAKEAPSPPPRPQGLAQGRSQHRADPHPPVARPAPQPPTRENEFLFSFLFAKPRPASLPPQVSSYAPPPPPFAFPRRDFAEAREPARGPAAPVQAVCVRLCDGAFFPAPGPGAGSQEGCARACPRAPVRLYHMTNGDIASAVSNHDGAPYSALPVAMRYASVRDKTCSCGASDHASALLRDPTLRRGDRVMTAAGFRVFKGSARPPYSPRDFHTLAQATYLPAQERASLRSMERAAGVRPQTRGRDFLASLQAVPPTAMP